MPQVQHAGRISAVLSPHPGMQQPDQQIGILFAPTAETRIEAIDALTNAPGVVIERVGKVARESFLTRPVGHSLRWWPRLRSDLAGVGASDDENPY